MKGLSKISLVAWPLIAALLSSAGPVVSTPRKDDESRLPSPHDMSSSAFYTDLKARGVDPLSSAAPTLRRAFVQYDAAMGGEHNLSEESQDGARSAKELNAALGQASLTSTVTVRTAKPGARIRYRLFGDDKVGAMPKLSNAAEETLAIGIYYVWAERGGKATSALLPFRIIRPKVPLDVEETTG